MAVTLDSLTRTRPAPCQHWRAIVAINSVPLAAVILTPAEVSAPITNEDAETLVRLWARYRLSQGYTLTALVGKAIFPETV